MGPHFGRKPHPRRLFPSHTLHTIFISRGRRRHRGVRSTLHVGAAKSREFCRLSAIQIGWRVSDAFFPLRFGFWRRVDGASIPTLVRMLLASAPRRQSTPCQPLPSRRLIGSDQIKPSTRGYETHSRRHANANFIRHQQRTPAFAFFGGKLQRYGFTAGDST